MTDAAGATSPDEPWLAGASVDPAVLELPPDYRALLHELAEHLTRLGPVIRISRRALGPTPTGAPVMTLPRAATDRA